MRDGATTRLERRVTVGPEWSVVVPTRDRRRELEACLARLAPGAQVLDATRYEVIVTDDGDFEATDAWLRTACPWARHVRGPRRGPAANRNAGARDERIDGVEIARRKAWFTALAWRLERARLARCKPVALPPRP